MSSSGPPSTRLLTTVLGALVALAVIGGAFALGRSTATDRTDAPPPATLSLDPVDVGFLQDMLDHHNQALVMATYVARNGDDPAVRNMAWNIVLSQSREAGQLDGLLRARGSAAGDPTRTVMAWMGMPSPLETMPGMASQDDLADLLNSTGADLDRRFLELMLVHHQGGLHMADYAIEHGTDPNVVAMAERIVVSQKGEIGDIEQMLGQ